MPEGEVFLLPVCCDLFASEKRFVFQKTLLTSTRHQYFPAACAFQYFEVGNSLSLSLEDAQRYWAAFKGTFKKAPEAPGISSQVTVKGCIGTSGDNNRFARFPQVTVKGEGRPRKIVL